MKLYPHDYVGSGREVYDARWDCWRACCGQPKPTDTCQNRKLHEAIRELDASWRNLMAYRNPKPEGAGNKRAETSQSQKITGKDEAVERLARVYFALIGDVCVMHECVELARIAIEQGVVLLDARDSQWQEQLPLGTREAIREWLLIPWSAVCAEEK